MISTESREATNVITNSQVDNIRIYIRRSGSVVQFALMEDGRIGIFATKDGESKLLTTTTQESFKETYSALAAN